jgi:hypothetical protein
VKAALEAGGHQVWLDRSDIRCGVLLREELHQAIQKSSAVILLWSKAAAQSRWVTTEILTAFHLDRFIVPCALDPTPLPQFLGADVYLDFRKKRADGLRQLCARIGEVPKHANPLPPFLSFKPPELELAMTEVWRLQAKELDLLGAGDTAGCAKVHAAVERKLKSFPRSWRLHSIVLNLTGYHYKNAFQLKFRDHLRAGRRPDEALLRKAEWHFFQSLLANPVDYSALNGVGSILVNLRELNAAEFFVRRAITLAERDGADYAAARQDLERILYFKRQSTRANTTP